MKAEERLAVYTSTDSKEPWRARLNLAAYQVKDAAHYAEVATRTVRYWQQEGKAAGSAIAKRKARESLSYLQLQELAIVSVMRKQGIALQKIRLARDYLRQHFKLEFPFSDKRVKVDGQDILMEFKELGKSVNLLVASKGGQLAWKEIIGIRFEEFEYERDLAVRWHVGGRQSGIIIDPRIGFGAPAVRGVATWALRGRYVAGEPVEYIAKDFQLTPGEVRKGLKFEGVQLH